MHIGNFAGGGSSSSSQGDEVTLLLIDELQHAYPTGNQRSADCDPMNELWTFIKRLAAGDARARKSPLRIVAAAVFGDAPSFGAAGRASRADMLHSLATTPFEIGEDRQVRLHRSNQDHCALAYTDEEFDELWTLTWGDHESKLFAGTAAKESIRFVTAKQVCARWWSSYTVQRCWWPGVMSVTRVYTAFKVFVCCA